MTLPALCTLPKIRLPPWIVMLQASVQTGPLVLPHLESILLFTKHIKGGSQSDLPKAWRLSPIWLYCTSTDHLSAPRYRSRQRTDRWVGTWTSPYDLGESCWSGA